MRAAGAAGCTTRKGTVGSREENAAKVQAEKAVPMSSPAAARAAASRLRRFSNPPAVSARLRRLLATRPGGGGRSSSTGECGCSELEEWECARALGPGLGGGGGGATLAVWDWRSVDHGRPLLHLKPVKVQ